MKEAKNVLSRQLKNLQTGAGPSVTDSTSTKTDPADSHAQRVDVVDAVNYLFVLLRDAFPQQFVKAYPTREVRQRARSLWAEGLKDLSPKRIKRAAEKAIRDSKFMPSLGQLRSLCALRYEEMRLKDPLQAYYEACNAPSQSREYGWSHLAVYLAARETGWFMIRGEPQETAFPVFERNYEILCNRVLDGEDLEAEITRALENASSRSRFEQVEQAALQRQQSLMKEQGIDPKAGREAFLSMKETLSRD